MTILAGYSFIIQTRLQMRFNLEALLGIPRCDLRTSSEGLG